jgi:hypothetical protein
MTSFIGKVISVLRMFYEMVILFENYPQLLIEALFYVIFHFKYKNKITKHYIIMKNIKKLSREQKKTVNGGFTDFQIDACGSAALVCFRGGGAWDVGKRAGFVICQWYNNWNLLKKK